MCKHVNLFFLKNEGEKNYWNGELISLEGIPFDLSFSRYLVMGPDTTLNLSFSKIMPEGIIHLPRK